MLRSTSPISFVTRRRSKSWRRPSFRELIRGQPLEIPIRIWDAGCSTGEETYSIAMLFLEAIASVKAKREASALFASDVDDDALTIARRQGLCGVDRQGRPRDPARPFLHQGGSRLPRHPRTAGNGGVYNPGSAGPVRRSRGWISCRAATCSSTCAPMCRRRCSCCSISRCAGGRYSVSRGLEPSAASVNASSLSRRSIGSSGILAAAGRAKSPSRSRRARAIENARRTRRNAPRRSRRAHDQQGLARQALLDAFAPASGAHQYPRRGPPYYFGPIDRYLKVAAGEAGRNLYAMAPREGLGSQAARGDPPGLGRAYVHHHRARADAARGRRGDGEAVGCAGRVRRRGAASGQLL